MPRKILSRSQGRRREKSGDHDDVYKERLAKNDWLTPETREKAIVKLNVIKPYIGYPEELPERYKDKVVDENASLFDNALALRVWKSSTVWSKWNQPVDYKEWGMPAHMVNAYYNPQKNLIVFPAAILQAPFYDLHQSSSANYGGIGQLLPMKFPTPLIPTELPLMKMVASRIGGLRATMLPSRRKHKKSLTNLMDRILMEQPLTVN